MTASIQDGFKHDSVLGRLGDLSELRIQLKLKLKLLPVTPSMPHGHRAQSPVTSELCHSSTKAGLEVTSHAISATSGGMHSWKASAPRSKTLSKKIRRSKCKGAISHEKITNSGIQLGFAASSAGKRPSTACLDFAGAKRARTNSTAPIRDIDEIEDIVNFADSHDRPSNRTVPSRPVQNMSLAQASSSSIGTHDDDSVSCVRNVDTDQNPLCRSLTESVQIPLDTLPKPTSTHVQDSSHEESLIPRRNTGNSDGPRKCHEGSSTGDDHHSLSRQRQSFNQSDVSSQPQSVATVTEVARARGNPDVPGYSGGGHYSSLPATTTVSVAQVLAGRNTDNAINHSAPDGLDNGQDTSTINNREVLPGLETSVFNHLAEKLTAVDNRIRDVECANHADRANIEDALHRLTQATDYQGQFNAQTAEYLGDLRSFLTAHPGHTGQYADLERSCKRLEIASHDHEKNKRFLEEHMVTLRDISSNFKEHEAAAKGHVERMSSISNNSIDLHTTMESVIEVGHQLISSFNQKIHKVMRKLERNHDYQQRDECRRETQLSEIKNILDNVTSQCDDSTSAPSNETEDQDAVLSSLLQRIEESIEQIIGKALQSFIAVLDEQNRSNCVAANATFANDAANTTDWNGKYIDQQVELQSTREKLQILKAELDRARKELDTCKDDQQMQLREVVGALGLATAEVRTQSAVVAHVVSPLHVAVGALGCKIDGFHDDALLFTHEMREMMTAKQNHEQEKEENGRLSLARNDQLSRQQIATLEQTERDLRNMVDEQHRREQKARHDHELLSKKCHDLEVQLDIETTRHRDLLAEQAFSEIHRQAAVKALQDMNNALKELQNRSDRRETDFKTLQIDLDNTKRDLNNVQDDNDKLSRSLEEADKAKKAAEADRATMKQQMSDLDQHCAQQLSMEVSKLDTLTKELKTIKATNADLEQRLVAASKLNLDAEKLEEAVGGSDDARMTSDLWDSPRGTETRLAVDGETGLVDIDGLVSKLPARPNSSARRTVNTASSSHASEAGSVPSAARQPSSAGSNPSRSQQTTKLVRNVQAAGGSKSQGLTGLNSIIHTISMSREASSQLLSSPRRNPASHKNYGRSPPVSNRTRSQSIRPSQTPRRAVPTPKKPRAAGGRLPQSDRMEAVFSENATRRR